MFEIRISIKASERKRTKPLFIARGQTIEKCIDLVFEKGLVPRNGYGYTK